MRQSASEILVKTENYLDTLSNQLIEGLTQIIEGDWGISKSTTVDKVNLLEIEVFIDGYRIVLYPMGSSSTQLGYRTVLKEEYADGILNDEELNPNLDEYDFQNDADNEDLFEFDKAQRELFLQWFIRCWNRTDSTKLTIPVYLTFHDTGDSLDLKRNKWVSEK